MSFLEQITLRRATESDLRAVLDIVHELLATHVEASGGDLETLTVDFLRATMEDSTMLVSELNGEPIGYLQYQIVPPALVVNGAAVRSAYQRQGIATHLFRHAVDDAAERGCDAVHISVQPTNVEVWETYLRHGFHEMEGESHWNLPLVHELSAVQTMLDDKMEQLNQTTDS